MTQTHVCELHKTEHILTQHVGDHLDVFAVPVVTASKAEERFEHFPDQVVELV